MPCLQLEVVDFDGEHVLLMATPPELPVRLNGHPVPPMTRLRIGDQIQFAERDLLHVTAYQRPAPGPPDVTAIGKACPVCRVPFVANSRVYVCSHCGIPMHDEGDSDESATDEQGQSHGSGEVGEVGEVGDGGPVGTSAAGGKRLDCARLVDACPFCQRPVDMEEGYVYVPAC